MRVSLNETSALLRRAFEGLGFSQAACEDAAAMALWLEVQGLRGLDALAVAWPWLGAAPQLRVVRDEPGHVTLDAGGASALRRVAPAIELALANAAMTPLARVEVRNLYQRRFALERLIAGAGAGRALLAWWRGSRHLHVAEVGPEAAHVRYGRYATPEPDPAAASGFDVICAQPAAVAECVGRLTDGLAPVDTLLDAMTIARRRQRALESGLPIDPEHWRRLAAAAAAVLVAASEQSRQGAGE